MSTKSVSKQTGHSDQTDPDSWENRIAEASNYISLTPQEVEEALAEYGVEKSKFGLEALSDETATPFGDLRKIFCDDKGVKLPMLRLAMARLRGPKGSDKISDVDTDLIKLKDKYGVELNISDIETEKLLEDYDPRKSSHPITKVLKERYKGQSVVIFRADSEVVDIEATSDYISDLEMGIYEEQETVEVDGRLQRVYPIGQVPDVMAEEDPLFPGHPLRKGRSTRNRMNWDGIDNKVKQFCRIMLEQGEIDPEDKHDVRSLVSDIKDGFKNLASQYMDIELTFRELEKKGTLPALKMSLQEATSKLQGHNNPFSVNRRY